MAGSRREVFRIADLVVTFQEEPGMDCYLVFELQDTKVKTSVSEPIHRRCRMCTPFSQAGSHRAPASPLFQCKPAL